MAGVGEGEGGLGEDGRRRDSRFGGIVIWLLFRRRLRRLVGLLRLRVGLEVVVVVWHLTRLLVFTVRFLVLVPILLLWRLGFVLGRFLVEADVEDFGFLVEA